MQLDVACTLGILGNVDKHHKPLAWAMGLMLFGSYLLALAVIKLPSRILGSCARPSDDDIALEEF